MSNDSYVGRPPGTAQSADLVSYNNSGSNLEANTVQEALDELHTPKLIQPDPFVFSGETEKNFNIPDWVSKISVMFDAIDASGTDDLYIRIGDSGGIEVTGYTGGYGYINGVDSTTRANDATGVRLTSAGSPTSGSIEMRRMNVAGTKWAMSMHGFTDASADRMHYGHWIKTLNTRLTQLVIELSGSDTIDSGNVNVLYE